MTSSASDIIQNIVDVNGNKRVNKDIQGSVEQLHKAVAEDGLAENELSALVDFLTTTKLSSSVCSSLFTCFIPETKISSECLRKLLAWYFLEVGHNRIANAVEKKFLQWLTGIVFYELADTTILDSYYYSFLFLLDRPQVQGPVCRLLCLLSKPEDAKRWVVQQILRIHNIYGPKTHTNSLLSLLKSYRPEAVPERVPISNFTCGSFGNFDEPLKKAHARNLMATSHSLCQQQKNDMQWNSWRLFETKKMLPRLIPAPESLNLETGIHHNEKSKMSIVDLKTMASLAIHHRRIEIPAQVLSLLANPAGHHLLAFSDSVIKTRFSHKLYHTLCKVFILELMPYSDEEKSNFLRAIKRFQDYTHQSVPVVTTFLFYYLLIWDGDTYQKEIYGLLEWIEVRNEEDLDRYVFTPLRQIYLSTDCANRCMIIETMRRLIRNLLVMDKRESNYFRREHEEYDLIKAVDAISDFVGGLVNIGLIWSEDRDRRRLLMTAIDFYETTQAVEQAGDLPLMIIMPPSVVYTALFSGSRLCVARLCSLFTRLQMTSVERLFLLGVFDDFATEVKQLNVYILDYYRCLWGSVAFKKEEDSFMFHENAFGRLFWSYKSNYGEIMDKIFGVEYNSTFWIPEARGSSQAILGETMKDFPSVIELKRMTEERLLQ